MGRIEICDICEEPTGNSGLLDDSYQCIVCGNVICEYCGEMVVNKSDGDTQWVCNSCLREGKNE